MKTRLIVNQTLGFDYDKFKYPENFYKHETIQPTLL